jgi:hypothetical protein
MPSELPFITILETMYVPRLLNTPTPVNNADAVTVPKSGVCARFTFGKDIKVTAVKISSNLFFILIGFEISGQLSLKSVFSI